MSTPATPEFSQLEQTYRLIAENLLDVLWVLDAETLAVEFITPSIERISGYTPDEIKGMRLQERLVPASLKAVEASLDEAMQRLDQGGTRFQTLEIEFIHKNGQPYWAEIVARMAREEDQQLKIVGVTREISERKKAEQQRQALIEKLRGALVDKQRHLREIQGRRGHLPICSGCKRIRDTRNKWWPLEAYINAHTNSRVTHSLCPGCIDVFYGDA